MRTGPSERFNKGLSKALGGIPIKEITEKSLRGDAPEEETIEKGGFGSGHYGHSGRPPKVGGSKAGGVKVGRAEMPDYASQFKFSGQTKLEDRPGGKGTWIKIQDGKGPEGTFVVQATTGKKRNRVAIGMHGGDMVEIGMKEMHDLRSKLRFVHGANEKGVRTIEGRNFEWSGSSLSIQVGKGKTKKQVTIPINQQVLDQLHYGVTVAKHAGDLSTQFPDEDTKLVKKIVREMSNQTDPFKWLNEQKVEIQGRMQPISLGGRCAILRVYTAKMQDQSLRRRIRANKEEHKYEEVYSGYINVRKKEWDEEKDIAEEKSRKYSYTQSMVNHMEKQAAAQFVCARGGKKR